LETRQGLIFGAPPSVKVFHHDMMGDRRPLARGTERKALGAYYTPAALVERALAELPAAGPRLDGRGESPADRMRSADLSCGEGAWLEAAARRWPGSELTGVDVDAEALAVAQRRVAGSFVQADGLRFRGVFDCVVGNPPWGAGRVGNVRRGA